MSVAPVFTVGAARNGTTMLGNQLALADEVCALQHELHHGIHESNLYEHQRYWGPLDDPDAYLRFVYGYASEDSFILADGERDRYLEHPVSSVYELYFDLMDRYAERAGKRYWTTKVDPLLTLSDSAWRTFAEAVRTRYGERARWIMIERERLGAMRSYLFMEGRNRARRTHPLVRPFTIALGAARYAHQYRGLRRLLADTDVLELAFADVVGDMAQTERTVDAYLGTQGALGVGKPARFRKNTSHGKGERTDLSPGERRLVRAMTGLMDAVPPLASALYRSFEALKPKRDPSYRKLLKRAYFPEALAEEFERVGAPDLKKRLDQAASAKTTEAHP